MATIVVLLGSGAVLAYFLTSGLSARAQASSLETSAARTVRRLVIGWQARGLKNPVPASEAVLVEARAHFADHCASCHANDGSGNTEMGRNLYPKAPDMRLPATQELSDGELFSIIENGIRFTGMPGWSTGTAAGEESSWHLVHFIRSLPKLSPEEIDQMQALNPRSPEEIRQEIAEEEFLNGTDSHPAPSSPSPSTHHEH